MGKPSQDPQLTEWGDPEKRIESQYGEVTYGEWCELEIDRLAKQGRSPTLKRKGSTVCCSGWVTN
jgi:hypothetical protein